MVRSRVGILYRGERKICSIRIEKGGEEWREELYREWNDGEEDTWDRLRNWISQECIQDDSYLSYFYRTLESGCEEYYVYEPGVGWACGDVTGKTERTGMLIRLEDVLFGT
jgi:hypothetical protein